jgi:hypothetical protein
VLVRPRAFFGANVVPGDQAPGLAFAVVVALAYASVRFAVSPARIPRVTGDVAVSAVVALLAVALLVAPAALHLTAALQTVLLIAAVPDRGGISETVQTIAYATAPCALASLPWIGVRVAAPIYGTVLLVVGLSEVHDTSLPRAAAVGGLPALLVFGYGYGGVAAAASLLGV